MKQGVGGRQEGGVDRELWGAEASSDIGGFNHLPREKVVREKARASGDNEVGIGIKKGTTEKEVESPNYKGGGAGMG